MPLDSRVHAYRSDLADIALAGRVLAPHYARPLSRACGSRPAWIRTQATAEGEALSELLPGERFDVLEYAAGWAWGYSAVDRIVGYAEAIALADLAVPTHIVCERCAPVMPDGRVTSSVLASLPMGSRLHGEEHGACLTTEYGCVPLSHLRRIEDHDEDPVIVAERLIGAPFLPGGRSHAGIDAPALVQLALSLCGIAAPRLIEAQRELGAPLRDGASLRRGDIVLAEETCGLMIDDLLLIHASRAAGKVTVEPAAAFDRPGTMRRRLSI